jgi:hypothetical protein
MERRAYPQQNSPFEVTSRAAAPEGPDTSFGVDAIGSAIPSPPSSENAVVRFSSKDRGCVIGLKRFGAAASIAGIRSRPLLRAVTSHLGIEDVKPKGFEPLGGAEPDRSIFIVFQIIENHNHYKSPATLHLRSCALGGGSTS